MSRRVKGPDRHLVHGEWMTEAEAAERLGFSRLTVRQWRYRNRRPDGGPALLEEAWDHYADVNAGRIRLYQGRSAEARWVRGRKMTRKQAAEALGVPVGTLDSHMPTHRCGLDAAWRHYSREKKEKAVREILAVIDEARGAGERD